MDTESAIQRTLIKQRVAALLLKHFGPAGAAGQWFRGIKRAQWRPGNNVRPCVWVTDGGTVRGSGRLDDDTTKSHVLTIRLVLDLVSHFEREDTMDDWSDRVERIRLKLENFSPAAGCSRFEVLNDDPMDVVLQAGGVEAVWLIECEVEYHVEVRAFGPDAP